MSKKKPATQTQKTSSTTSNTQNINQQVNPWAPLTPHLTNLFGAAQSAFNATNREGYQGDLYAGPNADQTGAVDFLRAQAPGLATGSDQLRQLGMDTVNGVYMDPNSNPFLRGAVDSATSGARDQLMRQILPAIMDQSIMQGAYGGSGGDVARGVAIGDYGRHATNAAADIYAQNYQAERQRQLGAGALFDQANSLALAPGQVQAALGDTQQGWAQKQLDANLMAYQMQQQAPWNGLAQYGQALGLGMPFTSTTGTNTSSGTQNGTQTMTGTSPSGGAGAGLQGALGGAATGFSLGGPWGAAIGGGLGLLGGLFG